MAPLPHAGKGVTLQTSSVSGALALRLAAGLRPLRPHSLRFGREQEEIEKWLAVLEQVLVAHGKAGSPLALELARLPRLLKGYGDTHAAGRENFQRLVSAYRDAATSVSQATPRSCARLRSPRSTIPRAGRQDLGMVWAT